MGFDKHRAAEALRKGKNVGGALVILMEPEDQ